MGSTPTELRGKGTPISEAIKGQISAWLTSDLVSRPVFQAIGETYDQIIEHYKITLDQCT